MNRKPLSRIAVVWIVVGGIGLNLAGAGIAQAFKLPLFLDSFTTFAVVALAGLLPGLAVAIATNAALAFLGPVGFPFVVCHILTAVGTWLIMRKREPDMGLFLWSGLLSGVSNGVIGSIISLCVYRGVTTIPQIDGLVLGVVTALGDRGIAVFWGGLQSNLIDKILGSLAAWGMWLAVAVRLRRPARAAGRS